MRVRQKSKLCIANSTVKPIHRPSLNEELMSLKLPYIAAQLFHSASTVSVAREIVWRLCPLLD